MFTNLSKLKDYEKAQYSDVMELIKKCCDVDCWKLHLGCDFGAIDYNNIDGVVHISYYPNGYLNGKPYYNSNDLYDCPLDLFIAVEKRAIDCGLAKNYKL